jgi:methylated-DNA-[protein]-cysteine S-methyltransferase
MPHLAVDTPFGLMTLHAEDGALVALDWGARPGEEAAGILAEARRQLEAYFAGCLRVFSVPLAPRGSGFQRRAWAVMAAIPFGTVRSYGGLAREIGTGPRALAGACARNPLPIFVPCHRVVAAGGAIGGFGSPGGLATKRALLALEGVRM